MAQLPKYKQDTQAKIISSINKLIKKSTTDTQLDTAFQNTRHVKDRVKQATLRRDIIKKRLTLRKREHAELAKKLPLLSQ